MRTWMRRGIPAALLAGGVLAMTAGNAAAAPAPIGDPTGVADTALRLTDLVGHKGLPPLPDTSQIQLPTMPIGQTQRSLDPQDLAGGGLSLSNVQLNGQDLPKPELPGLSALPALGGDQQRSIDPSHIAISDVPRLPKVPSLLTGLPVSALPDVTTSRSLPNVTYGGQVPTAGLHDLTKLPDLTTLSDPTQLPNLPQLPLDDEQQRSLPGTDLVGTLPVGGLLGGVAAERDLPGLPKLPLTLPGVPAGRSLPALPQLPLPLPGLGQRSLPGTDLLGTLPVGGLLGGVAAERDLPGLNLLGALPVNGLLGGVAAERDLPGLNLLGALPVNGLLGGVAAERDLPGLNLLGALPVNGLLGGVAAERDLPGLNLLGALPVNGLLGGVAAERSLPGLPALPALPMLGGQQRALPALPGLDMVYGLIATTPVAALLASTPLSSVAGRELLPVPAVPALPKLPLPGLAGQQRELPVVDSVLPKLPLAVPAVPGATVSGFHGIPALGPSFTTTMPADDSARTVVPGLPNTADVLGGVLGHAPRLPINGI
ncbi:hypothetical protein ACFFS4_18050 [Kutzneria kofuensis]|uniref:GLTT repeat-containing protein n=1 Tax=Kutzneria kofuensis TaxID=103725 RepID=A0A7W9NHI2_9PSEU|nr:hypothetical protein [Kutzneria kofuensis]MBB5892266.1 hypothetical protein [Kutzneria kofuensis]